MAAAVPSTIKYNPIFDEISYLLYDRYSYILTPLGIDTTHQVKFNDAIISYQEMQRYHLGLKKEYIKFKFIQKWLLLHPSDDINALKIDLELSDHAVYNFWGKSPKYIHLENVKIYTETEVPQDPNFVITVDEKDADKVTHPELFF
jgi:hypothetical protein